VLDAAFRQGISLMHGCKEGQCGSCKSKLIDGDIELLKYSTFALPDYESETSHVLLCRTHAFSDVSFELLNYDEDLLSRSIAVKAFAGRVAKISALTSDIRLLEIEIEKPLKFWAGQYVDLTLGDGAVTRAFSMANALHHQEISKRRVFVPTRWKVERRRCPDCQRALWHLLPEGGETRPDAIDRWRLGHVAALVDPG
jgi:ferredoxin